MIDQKTGIDFPLYQSQLYDIFGEPSETGEFAQSFLRTMDFSEFRPNFDHVVDYEGNSWSYRIYGNYILEAPLRKAVSLIVERGLAHDLKSWDGCFNIRPMKGSQQTSMHAWGVADDFNATTNPFGLVLITDFSPEFIRCFADAGFEWGGLWGHPNFDAMHFQLAWTRDWRGSSNPLAPVAWEAS